jgi:hypothetical protein
MHRSCIWRTRARTCMWPRCWCLPGTHLDTSGCWPTLSRAWAWCRATGSVLQRFRSPRPARGGLTMSALTCATTCATRRSRRRAASTSCKCSRAAFSLTICAVTGPCGRCGSWRGSIAAGSRSSPRPTTRSSTAFRVSTFSACSSRPTGPGPCRGGPSLRRRPPGWWSRRSWSARRAPASSCARWAPRCDARARPSATSQRRSSAPERWRGRACHRRRKRRHGRP